MTEAFVTLILVAVLFAAIIHAIDHSKPTLRWVERRRRRYVQARALYEAAEAALAAHQRSIDSTERELVRRTVQRKKKRVDDRQTVLAFGAM